MHDDMLARFVRSFQQAIDEEMAAMRERMGSFEVLLTGGTTVSVDEQTRRGRYRFALGGSADKLMVGMECSLRIGGNEQLVAIESLQDAVVVLRSTGPVALGAGNGVLVVYPWFLYERLKTRLGELRANRHDVARALALFGKLPRVYAPRSLVLDHDELNDSQRRAVRLCSDSSVAFLWGPPGTGKTATLAHVADELLAQGQRLLILSTTNAAVDQALAQIARRPNLARAIERGELLRLGYSDGDNQGAGLHQAIRRLHGQHDRQIARARERLRALETALRQVAALAARLGELAPSAQTSLFERTSTQGLRVGELLDVFGRGHAARIARLAPDAQSAVLARRGDRLARARELTRASIERARRQLAEREVHLVTDARAVVTTLTASYFSPLLENQRFDTVLVDEASMAVLPSLFYSACLAREKTVMVGDPRQLPPIVQSSAPYVRRAMGRSIFEVGVSDPEASDMVVMLDTQYRMHPEIGELVSRLFYSGRLRHGASTQDRLGIAERAPYAGRALVVVDTAGTTRCSTRPGSFSRSNESSAALCVELAAAALAAGIGSIAVITPYADQAREIQRRLAKLDDGARVECSTVHRFQGHERDMVIFDTVDAAPLRPGVLLSGRGEGTSAANLINVSLSRARGKLVIVSDVEHFRTYAPDSLINELHVAAVRTVVKRGSA
jgi:superfamily I DNA and/or RNA helicase